MAGDAWRGGSGGVCMMRGRSVEHDECARVM